MNKVCLVSAALAFVLCACASPQEKKMTEEFWTFSKPAFFTPENLLVADTAVKEKALADYAALDQDSKEKVITYIAYMLADEKDALIRHEIFDLLRDINAGPFVVAPLIRAYGGARLAAVRTEISQFINEYKPYKLGLSSLVKLLGEKNWDTRIKAIRVLSSMKAMAGPALPEIINVMHETGPSYGLYEEIFDFAQGINREALLASVALDIAGPLNEIIESAMRKMYGVYTDDQSSKGDRETALKSLTRTLYNGDAEHAELAKNLLERSGTEEAKTQLSEHDAYKKMKVKSMEKLTKVKILKKFAEEEDDLYLTLKLYLIKQGRNDAIKAIFDPSKRRK